MGCKSSKPARAPRISNRNTRPIFRPPPGVPATNFYFRNKNNCTECKAPGSLYMQSFEISQCKSSTFYVCDATAATYIMNCENCNIIIGPTEDTISIKDCQNCKFILAAKEVRVTNSSNCEFLLYTKDKPSLERCNLLKFGCYDFSYFEMQKQMELCRLPLWCNRWSEITNYTGGNSWDYLPLDTKFQSFMPNISAEIKDQIKFQPELRIIPQTYGLTRCRDESAVNHFFLAFMPSAASSSGLQFTDEFQDTKWDPPLYLIRTGYKMFDEDEAKKVFNRKPYIIAQCTKGGTALLHFMGNKAKEQITELLKSQKIPEHAFYVSPNYDISKKQIELIWND